MKRSDYLTRLRRSLVLGAVVAGVTASAAVALPVVDPQDTGTASLAAPVSRPPDVQDAATASYGTPAGLKADGLRWQGIARVYQQMQAAPDVVERYAATHPSGTALSAVPSSSASRPPDIRDASISVAASAPDLFERYAAVHGSALSSGTTSVSRPPDVADTALAVRYGSTSTVQSDGFDWSDWAIGIGSGLGIALLLGACIVMGRQLRHRAQTA